MLNLAYFLTKQNQPGMPRRVAADPFSTSATCDQAFVHPGPKRSSISASLTPAVMGGTGLVKAIISRVAPDAASSFTPRT